MDFALAESLLTYIIKMRSIKRRFERVAKANPNMSSYICFANAIKGMNFSKDRLSRFFNELVDKGDYAKTEKRPLMQHLGYLTTLPRRTENNTPLTPRHINQWQHD